MATNSEPPPNKRTKYIPPAIDIDCKFSVIAHYARFMNLLLFSVLLKKLLEADAKLIEPFFKIKKKELVEFDKEKFRADIMEFLVSKKSVPFRESCRISAAVLKEIKLLKVSTLHIILVHFVLVHFKLAF